MKIDVSPYKNDFFTLDNIKVIKSIESRYEFEDKLHYFVSVGNKAEAVKYFKSSIDNLDVYDLPIESIEKHKMTCRVINVGLRIAARRGGLYSIFTHNISEGFAMFIYRAEKKDELSNDFIQTMIETYCDAVKYFSILNCSSLIENVVKEITTNVTRDISLNSLAKNHFVSKEHLARKFKDETGYTVTNYINMQRTEYSKVLLMNNNLSITYIAHNCGFKDCAYFTRVFKNLNGISPSEYRKK